MNGDNAKGVVHFKQPNAFAKTQIEAEFTGLNAGDKHGFQIHSYGNLSEGYKSTGPIYNPFNKPHGGPEQKKKRNIGDLGNVEADEEGNGYYWHTDAQVQLHGPHTVFGRTCVLHENEDDLGQGDDEESKISGNVGGAIACGLIGAALVVDE